MTTTSGAASSFLSERIRAELWRRIAERLSDGESLVTRRDYYTAVEVAFRDFTGESPPPSVRSYLRRMVDHIHETHPETYLARGVQNAVKRAFASGICRLAWDEATVERRGSHSLQRFLRRDRIRELLDEVKLDPSLIDLLDCVQHGLGVARAPIRTAAVSVRAVQPTGNRAPPVAVGEPLGLQGAADDEPSEARAFASMQRIRPEYDGLLKLLIRHREHVLSGDTGDRTPLTTALLEGGSLLELAVAAVAGEEPELRRLAARESPYDLVAPFKLEPVPEALLEEGFIDDLRRLSPEAFAERLRGRDGSKPAADVRCLILLIDHLLEPTPFRRKVRLLSAGQALQHLTPDVETLYRNADRIPTGRTTAERLLRQRLQRVFTDASKEEETAVNKRVQALLMGVEQKLVAETEAATAEILGSLESGGLGSADLQAAEDLLELSDTEISRGAQMTSVEVRDEGGRQLIPCAIMPDPDDSKRFVMAERDAETSELMPQRRRGRPRYVDPRPDGSWMALTG